MVRTKQFDNHAALDEAMQLFWERGYHATSIQDLVDRLGVNRQSLYDTFGGKDQMFLAALERYREIQAAPVRRLLEREGPALEVLREFLHTLVDNLLSGDFNTSCSFGRSLRRHSLGAARPERARELSPPPPAFPPFRGDFSADPNGGGRFLAGRVAQRAARSPAMR